MPGRSRYIPWRSASAPAPPDSLCDLSRPVATDSAASRAPTTPPASRLGVGRAMPGFVLAAALLFAPLSLAAQDPPPRSELRLNVAQLSLGGRVQTQFNTSSLASVAPSQFVIRRARIEIGVRVNEWVSGAIQPEFGGGKVELKDANLKLHLTPGLQFLAGQAHRPFGLLEQTSSKRMLPVERGLRIRGLGAGDEYSIVSGLGYSNRDIGVQLFGTPENGPMGMSYAVGWFRGPLHGNVGAQDSYQFAARTTLRPTQTVRIGAGWSSRDFIREPGDTPELERGHAFEVDLEYGAFSPGLHLLAELTRGDLDPGDDASFWGAHAWLAYRTEEVNAMVSAVEPLLRVSLADTDAGDGGPVAPGGTLLTPGINVYFGPLNRVMLNYDIWLGAEDSTDAQSFKAMFQLAF